MTLTFLGTGPIKSIPRPDCYCSTCKDARHKDSKSRRTRSSVLIQFKNKNILIDASPDFLEQIKSLSPILGHVKRSRNEKISTIDAVLITHGHFDAIGGIKQLDRWLKNKTIPIYLEKATWMKINKKIKNLKPVFLKLNQKSKTYGECSRTIENLKLIPFRVIHDFRKEFPTLGFKIGRNLVYASDFKKIPKNSLKYIRGIKIAILDGAMYFKKQIFSHQNVIEAIKLAEDLNIKNLYLTQISHTYPPHKIAEKEITRYLRKNKIKTKVYLAYDGLKIEL